MMRAALLMLLATTGCRPISSGIDPLSMLARGEAWVVVSERGSIVDVPHPRRVSDTNEALRGVCPPSIRCRPSSGMIQDERMDRTGLARIHWLASSQRHPAIYSPQRCRIFCRPVSRLWRTLLYKPKRWAMYPTEAALRPTALATSALLWVSWRRFKTAICSLVHRFFTCPVFADTFRLRSVRFLAIDPKPMEISVRLLIAIIMLQRSRLYHKWGSCSTD